MIKPITLHLSRVPGTVFSFPNPTNFAALSFLVVDKVRIFSVQIMFFFVHQKLCLWITKTFCFAIIQVGCFLCEKVRRVSVIWISLTTTVNDSAETGYQQHPKENIVGQKTQMYLPPSSFYVQLQPLLVCLSSPWKNSSNKAILAGNTIKLKSPKPKRGLTGSDLNLL